MEHALLRGVIDAIDLHYTGKGNYLRTHGLSVAGWQFTVERVLAAVDDDSKDMIRDLLYGQNMHRIRNKVVDLKHTREKWQAICRLPGVTTDTQGRISEASLPAITAHLEHEQGYGYIDSRRMARRYISEPYPHVSLFEELRNRHHRHYRLDPDHPKKVRNPKSTALQQIDKQFAYLAEQDRSAVAAQIQYQRLCSLFLRGDQRLQEDLMRYLLRSAGRDDSVVDADIKVEGRSQ